ncbi:MAG: DUF839 domain-containing protein, partial [Myxococcales bacterium FL481]
MKTSRRSFLTSSGAAVAVGSMSQVIASRALAYGGRYRRRPRFAGYGDLIADPNDLLLLPEGFQYRVFSREGDAMTSGGIVPSSHDGMAAFRGWRGSTWLVRNHEIDVDDIEEDGLIAVEHIPGSTYDPDAVGGTTTLCVSRDRRLISDHVSLAGTLDNCAGGPTPWGTWLSCEESTDTLSLPHGYVFEVDPYRGGNPNPIVGMGRFDHEAVAFGRRGEAYLTEDADGPHGCLYRYRPHRCYGGRGTLHAGGDLSALRVVGIDTDLSIVQTPGLAFPVEWVDVPNANPLDGETPVREQVIALGATPIQKCEGTWTDPDGSIWFVSSRGDGPDAEDEEDRSAAEHAGQIWRYDPRAGVIELVVIFPKGTPYDEPDNITVGPHGFALACTDGDDDQWLIAINDDGEVFPFAYNALNDEEFAGATFSDDGRTLFVNIQGPPGLTFAIWGP